MKSDLAMGGGVNFAMPPSRALLFHLSVVVQRVNSASVLGSMEDQEGLEDIFSFYFMCAYTSDVFIILCTCVITSEMQSIGGLE